MSNTLETGNRTVPTDLALSVQPDIDKDYFSVSIKNLKLDKTYAIQFQWVYEDGSTSEWSPGYQVVTATEGVPGAPSVTVPSTNASHIPVTLSVFPANVKRVDVYIIGGAYGSGKVADSFLQAGTKTIAAAAGTYQVSLIAVSPSNINGDPTNTFTIVVTDPTANLQSPESSVTPSIPTVTSVLGAIQLSWNGKTSTGADQPYGFNAAKVYVGTTPTFTPSSSNQVDVLNFANGQNTLNIGVGTVVNGTAITYGVDYYVKIATTNGTDTSTAVSASGNPKQIGKVGSGDIVSVLADQITTGTLSATSTITVGATSGKHLKLAGTGDPLVIYGSGGVANPVLSFNGTKLSIVGDGTFTGSLTGSSGTFGTVTIGATGISSTNFSIANDGSASFNGILTASGGTIGGWDINGTQLRSTGTNSITLNPNTPKIALLQSGVEKITIDPIEGIKDSAGNFTLSPAGNLTLKGSITSGSTITGADITMTGAAGQTGVASTKLLFSSSNYAISAGTSSYTYPGTSGYYDSEGDWISATDSQTVTTNDIRFTDATYAGAVPYNTSFYYGELWLGSGTGTGKGGSVDLWANHPTGYIGISIVADSTDKNIIVYGDSSAGFGTLHRSSISNEFSESPAFLQADSGGRITRGRAILTGGSSNPNAVLGLTGDLYFSTAT
jgi:hypothetical protein